MRILGVTGTGEEYGSKNAAAALLEDGRLVAFCEEERYLHRKHTGEFPWNALSYVLAEGKTSLEQVDVVTFPFDIRRYRGEILAEALGAFPSPEAFRLLANAKWGWMKRTTRRLKELEGRLGKPFAYVPHHMAHAASAFFPSGYEEAAVLTVDGYGEWTTTTMGIGRGNRIETIKMIRMPHTLGGLWVTFTKFLGFRPDCDEGKVMGLAAYGKPRYAEAFRRILTLEAEGEYRIHPEIFGYTPGGFHFYFTPELKRVFGEPRLPEEALTERQMDIAASLQLVTEEAFLHMANWLQKRTGLTRLTMAGGVCLNSVANGRVAAETPFRETWVQPSADDAGNALGGPLHYWHQVLGRTERFPMVHPYWGPGYSDEEMEKAIRISKWPYRRVDDPADTAARLIAAGRILCWFQGRMEMGPRALGNRSILADPRLPEMKDIVNARVKHREGFRPFAPSILAERVKDYFEFDGRAPFMLQVYRIKQEMRKVIPAVTHVDGTGRIQTVTPAENALYHRLISAFERLTGVPVVLNTSFNIKGDTICMTPLDALKCWATTGIDDIVMGPFWVSKIPGDLPAPVVR